MCSNYKLCSNCKLWRCFQKCVWNWRCKVLFYVKVLVFLHLYIQIRLKNHEGWEYYLIQISWKTNKPNSGKQIIYRLLTIGDLIECDEFRFSTENRKNLNQACYHAHWNDIYFRFTKVSIMLYFSVKRYKSDYVFWSR